MSASPPTPAPRWYRTRNGQILLGALGLLGLYLLTGHWAHAAPYLPWLLIAACPLMHVFMHGGHGGHKNHGNHRNHGGQAGRPEPAARNGVNQSEGGG